MAVSKISLVALGIPAPLATELAAQVNGGTRSAFRLQQLGVPTRLAAELVAQMIAGTFNVDRLSQLSMIPAVGAYLKSGGGTPTPTPAPDVNTVPKIAVGVGDSIIGGATAYWPGYMRGMGHPDGRRLFWDKGRPGQYSQVVYNNWAADIAAVAAVATPAEIHIQTGTNDRSGATQTIQAGTGSAGNAVYYTRLIAQEARAAYPSAAIVIHSINYKADGSTKTNDSFIINTLKADVASGVLSSLGNITFSDQASVMSDPATGLPLSGGLFQGDNVHPTATGGRLMGDKLDADLVASGNMLAYPYPWTRNQLTTDPRNLILTGGGTFQGTVQGNGVAAGWTLIGADAAMAYSVVAAPDGVGNAQRLTIGAGETAFVSILRNVNISALVGHRIAVMCRTYGQNMEANAALAQIKWTVNGSNQNIYPMNASGFLGLTPLDGKLFHGIEFVVGASATTLSTSLNAQGNTGGGAATLDVYDVLIMDLG